MPLKNTKGTPRTKSSSAIGKTVPSSQVDVEHGCVGLVHVAPGDGDVRRGAEDRRAHALEELRKLRGKQEFILDDEDAHAGEGGQVIFHEDGNGLAAERFRPAGAARITPGIRRAQFRVRMSAMRPGLIFSNNLNA